MKKDNKKAIEEHEEDRTEEVARREAKKDIRTGLGAA